MGCHQTINATRHIKMGEIETDRRVVEVPSLARIEVEEDSRHNNGFLLKKCREEVEAIIDCGGQVAKIEPKIEGRGWNLRNQKAHLSQSSNNVISLSLEMSLKSFHFIAHLCRLEHWRGSDLERHVRPSVQI